MPRLAGVFSIAKEAAANSPEEVLRKHMARSD
jgi:hypothetical protein